MSEPSAKKQKIENGAGAANGNGAAPAAAPALAPAPPAESIDILPADGASLAAVKAAAGVGDLSSEAAAKALDAQDDLAPLRAEHVPPNVHACAPTLHNVA